MSDGLIELCGNCGETFENHEPCDCEDVDCDNRMCVGDEVNTFRSETDEDRAALRASAMEGGL